MFKEIEVDDMQLAIKLSDERTVGLEPRQRIIHEIEKDVNEGEARDLLKLFYKDNVLHRYPPGMFNQRCYSYIPGGEAFPEGEGEGEGDEEEGGLSSSSHMIGSSSGYIRVPPTTLKKDTQQRKKLVLNQQFSQEQEMSIDN